MDNLSLIYENSLHNKIRRDVLQEFIYQKTNNKHQKAEYMVEHVLNSSELEYLTEQGFLTKIGQNVPDIILQRIAEDSEYSQQSRIKATVNSLSTNIMRSNSENIDNIEIRNFAKPSNARAVILDSRMDGFIGEGIFDDSDKIAGYGYGYRMGADGEYDELEYIDTSDITFFSDKFKQSVVENGIENVCPPEITFYIANLAVDKPYRSYVKPLLNALLNRISSEGYKYIAFDGLSDTMRLFDSARKASRLSDRNLIKLAESDQGESKFVIFYIK